MDSFEVDLFFVEPVTGASGLAPNRTRTWKGSITISPLWTTVRIEHNGQTLTRILPPDTPSPIIEMLLHDWLTES